MRRLSIIDLRRRPPADRTTRTAPCWVVFNGEIYNYRELRDRAAARAATASATQSDTEVIVHLYEEHGDDLVQRLRRHVRLRALGRAAQRRLLARDRLGIKPLYYAEVAGACVFASEIKALLASGAVGRDLDLQALDAFLAFTYIPAPLTIFRGVRKLEPGHLLVHEAGRTIQRRYWDLDVARPDDGPGEENGASDSTRRSTTRCARTW